MSKETKRTEDIKQILDEAARSMSGTNYKKLKDLLLNND